MNPEYESPPRQIPQPYDVSETTEDFPPDCEDGACKKCYRCYSEYVAAKMAGELD